MNCQFEPGDLLPDPIVRELNQVIVACERLIAARGERCDGGAVMRHGPWSIYFHRGAAVARLLVEHHGEDMVDVYWPSRTDPGRLLAYRPGPWRDELLAMPTYDA